ncbi:MAG: hypothetical protein OK436_03110 [Thaumarchaeota archaeon]|nr:hypothetical protein [Nitrososphaerota archaeon]
MGAVANVQTDATLSGNGTGASLLKVVGVRKCAFVYLNDGGTVIGGKYMAIAGQAAGLADGFDTLESAIQVPMPFAGTFKNLYVNQIASAASSTITLRKNAASTALAVSTTLNTISVVSDTVDTVAVVAGDLVCYLLTNTGFSGQIAVEFDPT